MPTKSASVRSPTIVAKAASISRPVLAFKTWICGPMVRAADSTSVNVSRRSEHWRVDEHGNTCRSGTSSRKSSSRFAHQLTSEKIDACEVAARPVEAGDKTEPDRVVADDEDDRDRRGCRLGRQAAAIRRPRRSRRPGGEPGRPPTPAADRLILGPAVLDRDVLALDKAGFLQALAKSAQTVRIAVRAIWLLRNPTTGIAGCCARAASGHATAAPPRSADELASPHIRSQAQETVSYRLKRVL